MRCCRSLMLLVILLPAMASADSPETSYIFPAGGQRGTEVAVRVGGLFLHDSCPIEMLGTGVRVSERLKTVPTIWFEGPVIPLPQSQQQENYPRDMAGTVTIDAGAATGARAWRVWTSQGATPSRPFFIGEFPEVVEQETDGAPVPTAVSLPVTINGRCFPREDIDVWVFDLKAGETVTCAALTRALGSPFDAHLEIRDPSGQRLAESRDNLAAADSLVRFTAPASGRYEVRVQDIAGGGLQNHVYRLTVTSGPFVDSLFPPGGRLGSEVSVELFGVNLPERSVLLKLPETASTFDLSHLGPGATQLFELSDLDEAVELEPNADRATATKLAAPCVVSGRIGEAGDVDCFQFHLDKGQRLRLSVATARIGSRLVPQLIVEDSQGKEILGGEPLEFTAAETGDYVVRITDQTNTRGGADFAYRLHISQATPDFKLTFPTDAITVERGKETRFKLRAERRGGYTDEIPLEFSGLPEGVTVSPLSIPKDKQDVDLVFRAEAKAGITASRVTIRGLGNVTGRAWSQTARLVTDHPLAPDVDTVLAAVALPTPWKVKGVYEVKYAQRGSTLTRRFQLERGDFAGPLEVRLSDRQARHLQGVTGPTISVPEGASEFEYTILLPPWMEIGRTSRSVIMAAGDVPDEQGRLHRVSFTSVAQNEQLVALIDPGQLSVDCRVQSLRAKPGSQVELPVDVGRGTGLSGPVRVWLEVPSHIQGITAEAIEIPADQTGGHLSLRFGAGELGPFNMPVKVRAETRTRLGAPVTAEYAVELVP